MHVSIFLKKSWNKKQLLFLSGEQKQCLLTVRVRTTTETRNVSNILFRVTILGTEIPDVLDEFNAMLVKKPHAFQNVLMAYLSIGCSSMSYKYEQFLNPEIRQSRFNIFTYRSIRYSQFSPVRETLYWQW